MAKRKPKGGLPAIPLPGSRLSAGGFETHDAPPEQPGAYYRMLVLTFLALVVVPSLAYGIYVFALASNLYVSEARFAVRAAREDMSSDILTAVAQGAMDSADAEKAVTAASSSLVRNELQQNPFVIANFLMSRAFVAELQSMDWLAPRFSRDTIDYLARLPPNPSLDAAWRYWSRHAIAAVDRRSNTIFVQVWAYTPEDARSTVELMIRRSEALLNEMEERGRSDLLGRTRGELVNAELEYQKALGEMSAMRTTLITVDPIQAASTAQDSFIRFEGERIKLQRELRALQLAENSDSPSANTLRQRAGSMIAEVDRIRDRITGYEADMRAAVNALSVYEELDLNRRFAQTRVKIAALALEEAELRSRRHSYFLYTFVAPSLPPLPDTAWRWQQWLLAAGLSFLAWLVGATFTTMIRESRF